MNDCHGLGLFSVTSVYIITLKIITLVPLLHSLLLKINLYEYLYRIKKTNFYIIKNNNYGDVLCSMQLFLATKNYKKCMSV